MPDGREVYHRSSHRCGVVQVHRSIIIYVAFAFFFHHYMLFLQVQSQRGMMTRQQREVSKSPAFEKQSRCSKNGKDVSELNKI